MKVRVRNSQFATITSAKVIRVLQKGCLFTEERDYC